MRDVRWAVCLAAPVLVALACSPFGAEEPPVTATDGGDQPTVAFCQAVDAAVCESFDDGGVPWGFGSLLREPASALLEVAESDASPPHALRVRVPPNGGSALRMDVDVQGTTARFECKVNVDSPVGPLATVFSLGLYTDADHSVSFAYAAGVPALVTVGGTMDGGAEAVAVPALRSWERVAVSADLSTGRVQLLMNDVVVGERATGPRVSGSKISIGVGAIYFGEGDPFDARYDDCTLTWR